MVGCGESVSNKILGAYQANIITNAYMQPFNSPIVKKPFKTILQKSIFFNDRVRHKHFV